jgi:hypothetical protein
VDQYRSWSSPLCSPLYITPTDYGSLTPTLNITNCHMYPLCNKFKQPKIAWDPDRKICDIQFPSYLLSPYLCILDFSVSSFHYNQ